MVLKLTFLMFRSGNHIDSPCRGLRTNVLSWGILGQKVSWKNMADSGSQPSESVKKKRRFFPCLVERIYMVAISVSQQVRKTLIGYNNLQKLALERHQNSKDHILSISDLQLRKSFQATVSNAKKNIDNQTLEITRRHIVQHKKVYLKTKNNMPLINSNNGTSGSLQTVVVMLLFFTRNPKMFQRFPGIWNNANLRTATVPSGTLNLWLKESQGLRKENIEGKPCRQSSLCTMTIWCQTQYMLCCTSTLPHFSSSFDKDQLGKSFATAGKSALKLANLPSSKMMGLNGAKIRLLYKG